MSGGKNIEKAIHFFLFPPRNIDNRFAMKQFSAFSTAAENIRNTRPWKKVIAQDDFIVHQLFSLKHK